MSYIVELGEPILREKTQPVLEPVAVETKMIIEQMVKTLKRKKGLVLPHPKLVLRNKFLL